MTYAPKSRFAIGLVALSLAAASCATSPSSSGTGGASGGNSASGGNGSGGNGSGGNSASGGNGSGGNGSGGNSASGGNGSGGNDSGGNASGGNSASGGNGSGGNVGTGGNVSSGGSGGGQSSGGATGSGGSSGGATGSGGTAGTGGATGAGGAAGATGSGGAGGVGGMPFFTDDFESDTAGKQPAGFHNLVSYNYDATNPQSDGTEAIADSTHTHNASKMAVHFHGAGNPALLELPLASGINHLYVRVWVYSSIQIGDGPSNDNHETFLGITGDPTSVNNQVRFGMIKGAIGTNQSATDDISPLQPEWYMPPMITANMWHCIELELDGTAAYNTLNAYSDGTLVHSITAGTDWQNGALKNTPNWMSGQFTDFIFGYQSFSSTTADVWMDDLALSTMGRIGCN
jgi:hypothetical protein